VWTIVRQVAEETDSDFDWDAAAESVRYNGFYIFQPFREARTSLVSESG
jgi:hypothetical protein